QSLRDLNLWQQTGATVVAIRRGEQLIVSPGPYAVLKTGDDVLFVGQPGVDASVKRFLLEK
ncbi:MAG: cation:proton antiporter regulatory subunit, partial [Bacilli bacterium]